MDTPQDDALVAEVLSRFDHCQTPRVEQLMKSLVRHLHAFIQDVRLTEPEWEYAIQFLTRTGHMSGDKRQEFILLSDVLGASMQVVGINNPSRAGATASTEATVFGPFFVEGSPQYELGADMANGAAGDPCYMHGRVLDTEGKPIPGAHIAAWQNDKDGFYDVQYEHLGHMQNRGQFNADAQGHYAFWGIRPTPYPIPYDGPVGDLLKASNRSPMRPAHVHLMVTAPGCHRLITHVFDERSEYLDSDAVFGVKQSLITPFVRHEAGTAPDGKQVDRPFYVMHYDIVLQPGGAD